MARQGNAKLSTSGAFDRGAVCILRFEAATVGCTAMWLEFVKMSGAGNDFVLIDNRAQRVQLTREQVVRLCHRHTGIGADGTWSVTRIEASSRIP